MLQYQLNMAEIPGKKPDLIDQTRDLMHRVYAANRPDLLEKLGKAIQERAARSSGAGTSTSETVRPQRKSGTIFTRGNRQ